MLLITFAFSIGAIYKAIDYMAKGMPAGLILKFIVQNLPYSVAYTIPISALFSTLLLFGRLSTDSELSAMKSGGLSLWQIASPVIFASFVLSCFCLYNNFVIYPRTTHANRMLLFSMGTEDPIKLLEEGRFIRDFPGFMIYVGEKNRNHVKDVIVHAFDRQTGKKTATYRANEGDLSVDKESSKLLIEIYNFRVEFDNTERSGSTTNGVAEAAHALPSIPGEKLEIAYDLNELLGEKKLSIKRKNMTVTELAWRIRNADKEYAELEPGKRARQRSRDLIELNQRVCLAIAPYMFVLIAVPLGIKSHRKESSAGMLISLAVMFIYYIFIILSDTFEDVPSIRPWLLPWVPIIGGQIAGWIMLRRVS